MSPLTTAAVLVVGGIGSLMGSPEATSGAVAPGPHSAEPTLAALSAEEIQASQEAKASASAAAAASASAKAEASASAAAAASASAAAAAEAKASADAEASAAAELAALTDPANYSKITRRDWALIEKDPDGHVGEKYIVYGHVTQADAATGTKGFRANTGGAKGDWYDYDINTIVLADAAIVADVVTDDMVKMYVTIVGAYTYDTQIGGSTTAVSVVAGIVENQGSSKD